MLRYRWRLFSPRSGFQWLWAAVLLFVAGGSALGARLLPEMWRRIQAPLFIPHFYLTIASIFFFIDDCSKTEDQKF